MNIKLASDEIFNIKNSTGGTVFSIGNPSTDTVQDAS